MNGDELRYSFQSIVMRAFQLDHNEYLRSRDKSFWGIGIDRSGRRFTPLFGNPSDAVLNRPFIDSWAGYSVGTSTKPQKLESDVLLVAAELLEEAADAAIRDALLLHEACHFVIDAGQPALATTSQDAACALAFRWRIRPVDTYHDEAFLRQFSAAARAVAGESAACALVELGMQFDAAPEDTEEFEYDEED